MTHAIKVMFPGEFHDIWKTKPREKEQKRYMEASNSVVKEVKKKILETEKFKIINSFQNHIKNHIISWLLKIFNLLALISVYQDFYVVKLMTTMPNDSFHTAYYLHKFIWLFFWQYHVLVAACGIFHLWHANS